MKAVATKLGVVQNLGLFDRTLRAVLTALLLGGPAAHLVMYDGLFAWWHGLSILVSVYVGMTGWLGWDPLYQAVHYKTCDLSSRNRCGTLPYQVDAALGHNPVPDNEYDRSIAGSHH